VRARPWRRTRRSRACGGGRRRRTRANRCPRRAVSLVLCRVIGMRVCAALAPRPTPLPPRERLPRCCPIPRDPLARMHAREGLGHGATDRGTAGSGCAHSQKGASRHTIYARARDGASSYGYGVHTGDLVLCAAVWSDRDTHGGFVCPRRKETRRGALRARRKNPCLQLKMQMHVSTSQAHLRAANQAKHLVRMGTNTTSTAE